MPLFGAMFPFNGLEFAGIAGMAMFASIPALLGLAIPYAVLYMRDSRNEEHDSEIGLKSALYFMLSLSILLILLGLTVLVVDFMQDKTTSIPSGPSSPPMPTTRTTSEFTEAQRGGFAMMVSGFAIGLFHLVMILGFTNDRRFPATKRVFLGWRLAIHSMVVLIAFTTLVVIVFRKDVTWKDIRDVFAVLLVWAPSWLIHLMLMRVYGSSVAPRRRSALDD